jgi:hypothetical protein
MIRARITCDRRNPRKRLHVSRASIVPRMLVWFPTAVTADNNNPAIAARNEGVPAMSSSEFVRRVIRRSTNRSPLRVCLPSCALVVISIGIASPALARSNFDGDWSVVVETRSGACTPTLRYPIAISNGVVNNAGGTPAAVTGRVTPNGAVRVTVQSGGSWASGSGHLSATSGTGVWRGQGTSGLCLGTWQAERRSSGAQVMGRGAPIYNYNSASQGPRRYYPGYPSR